MTSFGQRLVMPVRVAHKSRISYLSLDRGILKVDGHTLMLYQEALNVSGVIVGSSKHSALGIRIKQLGKIGNRRVIELDGIQLIQRNQ